MAKNIRVGVIGFGMAGRIFHTAVIAATPGLELACIVQRSGDEAARAYAHAKIYRSVEAIRTLPWRGNAWRQDAMWWSTSPLP
jgi:scyllo-inositol 2-dehydrogenase (NADP+)